MKCMYCGCLESKVIDSRSTEEGTMIRRRRECVNCGQTLYDVRDDRDNARPRDQVERQPAGV